MSALTPMLIVGGIIVVALVAMVKYRIGHQDGYREGYWDGYRDGYSRGLRDGELATRLKQRNNRGY